MINVQNNKKAQSLLSLFFKHFRKGYFVSYFHRLTCGLAGALFVYTHRKIVDLSQRHESSKINRFLAKR